MCLGEWSEKKLGIVGMKFCMPPQGGRIVIALSVRLSGCLLVS